MKSPKSLPLESASLPPARRLNPTSFAQQIVALEVGDSTARAQRLPAASTTYPDVVAARAKMRDSIGGQLAKIKAKPECLGRTYTTAVGHFNADDGDTLVVLTVTRLT